MNIARAILGLGLAVLMAAGAMAEQGPYMGFDYGAVRSNDGYHYCIQQGLSDAKEITEAGTCDSESEFLRFRGGYEFSPYIAAELFYTEATDFEFNIPNAGSTCNDTDYRGNFSMQTTGALMKWIYPAEKYSAFLRTGFHNWKRKGEAKFFHRGEGSKSDPQCLQVNSLAASGTHFIYGFGATYNLGPNMQIVGTYEIQKTKDYDLAGASAGLSFHF